VQAWLNDLAALASLLEALPPPLIQAEAIQGVSRTERQKRSKFLLTAVLAILIVLPICLIGVGVLTYFLVSQ
jgi:nitric oxide reductase large subunit